MPSSPENRKFYLRSPDLEFTRDGPIQIGNVITDMFYPQDALTTLNPVPKIMQGASFGSGRKSRESHASIDLSFSATLYEAFGGQADAKSSSAAHEQYDFDEIQSYYLERSISPKDAQTLSDTDEEVKAILDDNRPVYVVTGLKIAKGLRYSTGRSSDKQAGLGGTAQVTEEVGLQGKAEGSRGGATTEEWDVLGDCIIAYRLHMIKRKGFIWKTLQSKTLDPKRHGFMSHNTASEDDLEVDVGEVSQDTIGYFVEEEAYKGVREVDVNVEDASEKFSIVCRQG